MSIVYSLNSVPTMNDTHNFLGCATCECPTYYYWCTIIRTYLADSSNYITQSFRSISILLQICISSLPYNSQFPLFQYIIPLLRLRNRSIQCRLSYVTIVWLAKYRLLSNKRTVYLIHTLHTIIN